MPEPTIWERLAAPLPKDEIKLRVGQVTPKGQQTPYKDGSKANFLAYHDARHVMDRLDEVLGHEGWRDEYREVGKNDVECALWLLVDGEWLSKSDVGCPNNPASPEPEYLKSSYSDALKRAGVKWGIGRYLYALPESGWWPVSNYGKLSAENEAKVRARMFDGLIVEPPEDVPEPLPVPESDASDNPAPAPQPNDTYQPMESPEKDPAIKREWKAVVDAYKANDTQEAVMTALGSPTNGTAALKAFAGHTPGARQMLLALANGKAKEAA